MGYTHGMIVSVKLRRLFQFRLRSLFVLVALAALACYPANQVHWLRERRAFLAHEGVTDWTVAYARHPVARPTAPGLLWLLGEKGVGKLVVRPENEADVAAAKRLFPEAEIIEGWAFSAAILFR